jgi:hypothetical protein
MAGRRSGSGLNAASEFRTGENAARADNPEEPWNRPREAEKTAAGARPPLTGAE